MNDAGKVELLAPAVRQQRLAEARPTPEGDGWIQQVAIAVADELELRQVVDRALELEKATAYDAYLAALHAAAQAHEGPWPLPLERDYHTCHSLMALAGMLRGGKWATILRWAIASGRLPASTTSLMPAAQFEVLAAWRTPASSVADEGQFETESAD